jgi:hypothetical protein
MVSSSIHEHKGWSIERHNFNWWFCADGNSTQKSDKALTIFGPKREDVEREWNKDRCLLRGLKIWTFNQTLFKWSKWKRTGWAEHTWQIYTKCLLQNPVARDQLHGCQDDINTFYIWRVSGPPLWSSGHSSSLQIQWSGFDSRRYQIFWEVVGLERGPLSLVNTTEELLERKSSGSSLEIREHGRRDPSRWPHDILYPQKLALPSPTSGGRSVGIVRLPTQATEFSFSLGFQVLTTVVKTIYFYIAGYNGM